METQKPVSLLDFLIRTFTKTGGTVLDPAAGRFSTGVACFRNRRRFIGIELDAKNFNLGMRRLGGLGVSDGGLLSGAREGPSESSVDTDRDSNGSDEG